ncbi:MAG TPA: hypothetical protein VJK54_11320 [Chthoniobacterales bacterium]|nr:hypothetical protein [Chthoniobacterales bacterium]
MKKIILSFLLTALASSPLLLAQDNNQGTGDRVQVVGCSSQEIKRSAINEAEYNFPNNQSALLEKDSAPISHLGVMPKLMMNPATIEEEKKVVEDALGILGKRGVPSESSAVEAASISSNRSNQVLRLRGGGPKKSQAMGGLKATGDTSEEDNYASDADSSASEDINDELNTHIQAAIETEGRAHVASSLLEKSAQAKNEFKKQQALASGRADMETRSVSSVDSTWIQNTLYKTAQMKLGASLKQEQMNLQNTNSSSSNSPSSESQGLASKEKMASLRLTQAGLALTKAQRAEETAKAHLITEENAHQKILNDSFTTQADKENSSLNIIYYRALATYATSDHELKKLMRDLAEAKLATVNAQLMIYQAQHIEDDLSFLNEAETSLELAREAEEAAEAATDPIANEAAARNTWCEAFKKAFEISMTTNELRKKNSSSVSRSLPSSPSSSLAPSNDLLEEAQSAEQAWNQVVEICNNTLENKPASLKLKNAWEKDLEEAANQHSLWQIRTFYWKVSKTVENAKASHVPQDLALQQAEEINSVYNEIVETMRNKQNEAPARLQSWWPHDLQLIENQSKAHKVEFTKLQEAEARRKAKEIADAQAAKELSEAIEVANVAWSNALEVGQQADIAKVSADTTKTESDYKKVSALAQNAVTTWSKAVDKQKIVLSKISVTDRGSVTDKIQIATKKVEYYNQQAIEASRNAQEAAKRAAEHIEKIKADTQAAKELNEVVEISSIVWDNAVEMVRQTDIAKTLADTTQTESAYKEVNRLAQNAATAWVKAIEAKSAVLSKTTEVNNKASLNDKIQAAVNSKEKYHKIAAESLINSQEAAKQEAARIVKAKDDAQATKELNDAMKVANADWNNAIEAARQADIAKTLVDSTKKEEAYKECNRLALAASTAWVKAEGTKRVLLSKTTEISQKNSLNTEIQTAVNNKEKYTKLATEALANAQEKVRQVHQAVKNEVLRKIGEIRAEVVLIERRITEATETSRLASEKVERVDNKFFVQSSTRTRAKEMAEAAAAELERVRKEGEEEIKIAEVDLARWQGVLKKLEKSPKENAEEARKQSQEARLRTQADFGTIANVWNDLANNLERIATYWKKTFEVQGAMLLDYSLAAIESEQAVEYSKNAVKAYGKAIGEDANWREGNRWREAGKTEQLSIDCKVKGIEVRSLGKGESCVREYEEAAEKFKQASRKFKQAVQSLQGGRERGEEIMFTEASSLQSEGMTKKYKLQGVEAQEAGKKQLVADYQKLVTLSQKAADRWKESRLAKSLGKKSEGNSWSGKAYCLQQQADYQAKAIGVQEAGHSVLATGYREAVLILEKAAEQYEQSALAYAAGKENEGNSWCSAGKSLQSQVDYQVKAIEAQEVGKEALATSFRQAATTSQREAVQHEHSAKTQAELAKKIQEKREGLALIESKIAEITETNRLALEKVERVDNKWLVRNSTRITAKEKAEETEAALERTREEKRIAEIDLAKWQEVLRRWEKLPQENAAEAKRKSQEALSKAKTASRNIASTWNDIANSLETASEYWKRASEAQVSQAVDYSSVAIELECTIDKNITETVKNAKEAVIRGEIEELKRLSLESKAMKDASSERFEQWEFEQSMDRFNEAIEYLYNIMRAISSEGSENAALVLWKEASARSKESAEQYRASARTWAKGRKDEARSLDSAADILVVQARHAKFLAKAKEAEARGNRALANKWHEIERKIQQAVEPLNQSVRTHAAGKQDEGGSWNGIGNKFLKIAEKLEKAIDNENVGKQEIATKFREAAEQQARSVDVFTKAVKAIAAGKTKEGASWDQAGDGYNDAVEKLEKAIEAEVAGKQEVARKYSEAAEQQTRSIEFYTKSALAYQEGKEYEGARWKDAGDSYYYAAKKLGKAIEAELAGKLTVAQKYREVAQQQMRSAELFSQAARAYAAGKTDEGSKWNSAGLGLYNAAAKLVKAVEAEEVGKLELARKWREAAEQQMRSVEFYTQAARACKEGKEDESKNWNFAGNAFYYAAENLEKAIEAEIEGKPLVALKWREVADQQASSVEYFTKAARADALGKKDGVISWNGAGNGFYNAALKLGKAIEAEVAGKSAVAQKYREAAKQYKRSVEYYVQAAKAYEAGKEEEGYRCHNAGLDLCKAAENLAS